MEAIKTTLAYIEANLQTDLTLEELAGQAGYSLFHFCRLFAGVTGESVGSWLSKRRLSKALAEIAGGKKAIDVVLAYGFDTYAGFYKAFVRTYGCSPTRYLRIHAETLPATMRLGGLNMLSTAELKALLKHWPVAQTQPIKPLPVAHGRALSENLYTVGEDYLLKRYADLSRLNRMLALAKALDAQGLSAESPVPTLAGKAYLEDQVPTVLVRRVPGIRLTAAHHYSPQGPDYARSVGQGLARLHAALRQVEPQIPCDKADAFQICRDWALPESRKVNEQWQLGLKEDLFDTYLAETTGLGQTLPRQLIHRDPNPDNIFFNQGEVSGFVSFDLCEHNARLFDICYSATGMLCDGANDPQREAQWLDLLSGVLKGYHQVSPLTDGEKRALFHMLMAIEFIFCAYLNPFEDEVTRHIAAVNRRMLVFIAGQRQAIEAIAQTLA